MIRITYVEQVFTGYPSAPAVTNETRRIELDDATPFDAVIEKGRELMLHPHVRSVHIESRQAALNLLHHNDFGGHLIIGHPKPSRRNWGTAGWSKNKNFGNNVKVYVQWEPKSARYTSVALYNKKALNEFHADNEVDAEDHFKLLCDTWGKATPSNLKDQAPDAPEWRGFESLTIQGA